VAAVDFNTTAFVQQMIVATIGLEYVDFTVESTVQQYPREYKYRHDCHIPFVLGLAFIHSGCKTVS
jgi:hypothetical protein